MAACAAGGTNAGAAAGAAGAGSPCGACKFLRRRCVQECVFAPYFSTDQGAARFAAIHKVFGASNAAKLLAHLPPPTAARLSSPSPTRPSRGSATPSTAASRRSSHSSSRWPSCRRS
ncbi:hypothetical protein ACQ4PT_056210 [Festuca glaucescens]